MTNLRLATIGVWIGCGCVLACARPVAEQRVARVQSGLAGAFTAEQTSVQLIVNLREPAGAYELASDRRAAIARLQEQVIENAGAGLTVLRRFRNVPAFAARANADAFERLQDDPNVTFIQRDAQGGGQLKEAVPAIGGDKVKSMLNLTGKGVRVAVLDTGIVTSHPDLSDAVVAQHCFTQADCPPLFGNEGTSAEDDHGHGSNVAGIIASNGKVSSAGFAPDVEIVAVKVDDRNDSGRESDWVAGFDWVYDNLAMLKVQIVNVSIGSNAMYATAAECDRQEPALAAAVKNLVGAGVTVFAAAGNRGSPTMLSAPACLTGVIAVGATYDSAVGHQPPNTTTYQARWGTGFANCGDDNTAFDQITCFTNSGPRLDIVAPGAPIISDSLNGRTESYWGTSQACPAAAGVAVLMLQCNPKLKPAEIKDLLVRTGVPRMDAKNAMMFPSIRAFEAVNAACPGGAATAAAGSGGSTATAGAAGAAGSVTAGVAGKPFASGGAGGGTIVVSAAGVSAPADVAGRSAAIGGMQNGLGVSGSSAAAATPSVPLSVPSAPLSGQATSGCSCRIATGHSEAHSGMSLAVSGSWALLLRWRLRRRRSRR